MNDELHVWAELLFQIWVSKMEGMCYSNMTLGETNVEWYVEAEVLRIVTRVVTVMLWIKQESQKTKKEVNYLLMFADKQCDAGSVWCKWLGNHYTATAGSAEGGRRVQETV